MMAEQSDNRLTIKWPWEMVWMEAIDDFVAWIKEHLPPDHELQTHKLFPGIKWDGKAVFIVDDDTTGDHILMNFEDTIHQGRSSKRAPAITILKSQEEVAALIERDHKAQLAECGDASP